MIMRVVEEPREHYVAGSVVCQVGDKDCGSMNVRSVGTIHGDGKAIEEIGSGRRGENTGSWAAAQLR